MYYSTDSSATRDRHDENGMIACENLDSGV